MRSDTLDKTLKEIASFLKEAIIMEYIPDSFFSRLNESTKLISLLIFLVSISFTTDLYLLVILYGFSMLIAYLSRIDLALFLRRVWFFIPIFTLVVAIPSLFIVPGKLEFGFTIEGIIVMLRLVLRVTVSISYVNLVLFTTRWTKLLSSLRYIGVPNIFVSIVCMSYRYIFLFLEIAENLFLAKRMRTLRPDARGDRVWIGRTIGILAMKTQQLSKEVYQGMISRGFNRNILFINSAKFCLSDILSIICSIVLNVIILYLDRRF